MEAFDCGKRMQEISQYLYTWETWGINYAM